MQASLGTAIMRRKAAAERARNGFSDRFAFQVDRDVSASRVQMTGILAALQKIDTSISAAMSMDS